MRFLVDASLSPRIAEILTAEGHDGLHAGDVGLLTASDDVMVAAQADSRVVVSADIDFATMLALGGMEAVPSLIRLRSADHLTPNEQAALLLANLSAVSSDLLSGSVVSLSTMRLTVRPLPGQENTLVSSLPE
jgi:predicted nuclease of predicted toxin-antitoxin system